MSFLQFNDHERHLRAIIDAGLRAADPRAATARALRANPPRGERFEVVAVGKAAATMYSGLLDVWPNPDETIMVVPMGSPAPDWALVGDHPLPTDRSVEAGEAVVEFVEAARAGSTDTGFVVLLSGGASALMTRPELELEDFQEATRVLLRGGATIAELNCVRKHLDAVKGGKLAARMSPRWCDVYVLSDVLGDDVSTIGSGPWAPDPTFYVDALNIARKYLFPSPQRARIERTMTEEERQEYWEFFPGHSVLEHLDWRYRDGEGETPKPGDPVFDRVRHFLVANNETAVRGAAAKAVELGFRVEEPELLVQGDAAQVGRRLAARAQEVAVSDRPACLVLGGETTVDVGASHGRGGRNQEMALAAAIAIDGVPNVAIATFATDGVDGPTDAAGAIVTGETCGRARQLGIDPVEVLRRHDSYGFFERVGGHIKTGPTGTNVNDVAIALVYGE